MNNYSQVCNFQKKQMRKILLITALVWTAILYGQGGGNVNAGLDHSFIESFRQGKFSLLAKHLPTRALYKSLGKEMSSRSDKEIDLIVSKNTKRVQENWNRIRENLKKGTVRPSDIKVREKIVYEIQPGQPMQGMILVYEYKGRLFDDVSLIITEQPGKTYLLEIPNPLQVFTMQDTLLSESRRIKMDKQLASPGFGEKIQHLVKDMIRLARVDSLNGFGQSVVFHGPDVTRDWKQPVDLTKPAEAEFASGLMRQVKEALKDCPGYKMEALRVENESEGYWIIQPVSCEGRKVYFAFLMPGGVLLLGDIDKE